MTDYVNLGVNNVRPGFVYNVQIRGVFNGQKGPWSSTQQIDVFSVTSGGTGDKAPAAVNLAVIATIDSFILTWDAPTLNGDGTTLKDMQDYVIEVRSGGYGGNADAVYYMTEVQKPSDLATSADRERRFEFTYKMNKQVFGGSGNAGPYFTVYARDTTNNKSPAAQDRVVNASPSAPTSLTATAVVGGANIVWGGGTSTDIVEYVLQMNTSSMANPPVTGSEIYRGPLQSFSFSGVAGTTYYFRVASVDTFGQTAWYATQATAVPLAGGAGADTTPPAAPTSIVDSWVSTNYRMSWTAPADTDVVRYRVLLTANSVQKTYYATGTFYEIPIANGKDFGTAWPYTPTDIKVYAIDGNGNESVSFAQKTTSFTSAPATPTAPTLTPAISTGGIDLSWTAPTDSSSILESVEIYAGTSASPTKTIYSGTGTTCNFTISPIYSGTYYFRSRVKDKFGRYSSYSADASQVVTTVGAPTPSTVTNSLDTADPSNRTALMNVTWTNPVSISYSGTKIRFRVNGTTDWTVVDAGPTTSLLVRNLVPGKIYNLEAICYDFNGTLGNSGTWTAFSNQTMASDSTVPSSTLTPTATTGATSLLVSWTGATETDTAGGLGRYDVEIATNTGYSTGVIKQVVQTGVSGASISAAFTGLTAGTTYYARVRAVDAVGNLGTFQNYGGGSPTATVIGGVGQNNTDGSAPGSSPTPTGLAGVNGIHVRWTPVSNADRVTYEVHVSTSSGFTPSGSTKVGEIDGSYIFVKTDGTGAALAYSTNYYFKLIAKDPDGSAAASAASAATQMSKVNTADITALAVTANEIAANTITAGQIFGGTITANEIASNTITAGNIAAAGITADKLQIGGNANNMVPTEYADFEATAALYNGGGAFALTAVGAPTGLATSATQAKFGTRSATLTLTGANQGFYISPSATTYNIPVRSGSVYIVSAYVYSSASQNIQFQFKNSGGGPSNITMNQAAVTAGSWQRVYGLYTAGADVTNNFNITFSGSTGTQYVDGFMIEERVGNQNTPSGFIKPSTVIDGANIITGSLVADKITTGTLNASNVSITNLTAAMITTGNFSASRVDIGGSGSNLIPMEYAGFEFTPSYYTGKLQSTSVTATVVGTAPWQGAGALSMVTSSTTCETYLAPSTTTYNIPAEASQTYIISAYVKAASGTPTVLIRAKSSTGAVVDSSAKATTTSWTRISTTYTTPASTTAMQVGFANLSVTGTLYVDGVMVEKQLGAVTTPSAWVASPTTVIDGLGIKTGTIITDRMAAGTINADRLTAGSITTSLMTADTINGDRISAGTLNASKITAGTITTDRMSAGTINADRLTAGSITTALMTADTINGDRISAGTLNASKITAGTITTDRMTAGTIDADRLTTGSITTGLINAAGITADKLQIGGTSVNLIPAQWSDFEFDPFYYEGKMDGANATAVASTDQTYFGRQSCKVVTTVQPNNTVFLGISNTDYNFRVSPSTTYIVSAYIYQSTGSNQTISFRYKPQITGSNNDYTTTSLVTGTANISSGTWNRIYATFTTGASDDFAVMGFRSFSAVGTYYFDGVMLEKRIGNVSTPSPWIGAPQTVIDGGMITTGSLITDRIGLGLFNSNKLTNGSFERTGATPPVAYRREVTSSTAQTFPGWTLQRVSGDTTSWAAHEWGNSWSSNPNKVYNGAFQEDPAVVDCSINNAGDTIGSSGHGLAVGDAVIFKTLENASYGLTAGTVYYVVATGLTSDLFRVATSPGGTAITLTGDTTGKYVSAPPVGYEIVTNGTNGGYIYNIPGTAASLNYKYPDSFPIVAQMLKDNVATIFFDKNANLLPTESIDVSNAGATFNGAKTITAVETYSEPQELEIDSYSGTGTTATVTTKTRHGLSVGDIVLVSGIDQEGSTYWDGVQRVTVIPSTSQFQYTKPSGGTSGTAYGAYAYRKQFNCVSYAQTASNVSYTTLSVPGTATYGKAALIGLSGSTTAGAYYGIGQAFDITPDTVTKVALTFWYKVTSNAKVTAYVGNASGWGVTPSSATGVTLQNAASWTQVSMEYTVPNTASQVRFDIRAVAQSATNTGTVFIDGVQLIYGGTANLKAYDNYYTKPARSGLAKVVLQKSGPSVNGTELLSDPISISADKDYAIGLYYYGDKGVGIVQQLQYSASLPFSATATYDLNLNNVLLPEDIAPQNAKSSVSNWHAKSGGYVRLVIKNATTSPNGGAGYLYVEDCWFMEKGATSGEITDAGIRLFDAEGTETMSMMSDSSDGGDFIQLGSGIYLDGPTNTITTNTLAVKEEFTINGDTVEDLLWNYPKGIIARGSRVSQGTTTAGGAKPYLEVQADGLDYRRAYKIWTSSIRCFNSNGAAGQTELTVRYNNGTSTSNNPSIKPVTTDSPMLSTRVQGNNNFNYQFGDLSRYWSPSAAEVAASDGTFRFLLCYQGFGTTAADSVYINGSTSGEYVQLNIEDMGPQNPDIGIDRGADGDSSTTEKTYVKTFKPLWTASYREAGGLVQNNYMYQGVARSYGNERSAVKFDTSTIPDGATIKKVEVYSYCFTSSLASGVDAVIGIHRDTGGQAPNNWSGVDNKSTTQVVEAFSKTEGRWVDITTLSARVTGLDKWAASGTNRNTGFYIGPGITTESKYAGGFVGQGGRPPSGFLGRGPGTYLGPKLRITYSVTA